MCLRSELVGEVEARLDDNGPVWPCPLAVRRPERAHGQYQFAWRFPNQNPALVQEYPVERSLFAEHKVHTQQERKPSYLDPKPASQTQQCFPAFFSAASHGEASGLSCCGKVGC